MTAPNPAAVDFLRQRRSYPAKTLIGPGPERAEVEAILATALRVPDHGKLEPWRMIVLERAALDRMARLAGARAGELELDEVATGKGIAQFAQSPLAVVVVASPVPSEKVPGIEQTLSAGALCFAILAAATAAGWGANWLTGWVAHDRELVEEGLGLQAQEFVAGIIHLGQPASVSPDRPRPEPARRISWAAP